MGIWCFPSFSSSKSVLQTTTQPNPNDPIHVSIHKVGLNGASLEEVNHVKIAVIIEPGFVKARPREVRVKVEFLFGKGYRTWNSYAYFVPSSPPVFMSSNLPNIDLTVTLSLNLSSRPSLASLRASHSYTPFILDQAKPFESSNPIYYRSSSINLDTISSPSNTLIVSEASMGMILLLPAPVPEEGGKAPEDEEEHRISGFGWGYQRILNYFDPETQLPEAEIYLLPNLDRIPSTSSFVKWSTERNFRKLEKKLEDKIGFEFIEEASDEGVSAVGGENVGNGRLEIRIGSRKVGSPTSWDSDEQEYGDPHGRHHHHAQAEENPLERNRQRAEMFEMFSE